MVEVSGTATCAERGTVLRIDNQTMEILPEDCSIAITERSQRSIKGSGALSYRDGSGATRRVEFTVDHDFTEFRDAAIGAFAAGPGVTTTLTHSVERSGAGASEVVKDVVTFQFDNNVPVTLKAVRSGLAEAPVSNCGPGGRFEIQYGEFSTVHTPEGAGCTAGFTLNEGPDGIRYMLYDVTPCRASDGSCVRLTRALGVAFDIARSSGQ
jgi:hypothetical protein